MTSLDIADDPGAPDPAQSPAAPAPRGSLLGAISVQADEEAGSNTKAWAVGKIDGLSCLYRVLAEEEQIELQSTARAQLKLAEKVSKTKLSEQAQQTYTSALLLSAACVELLWTGDDGVTEPLHQALAAPDQMGDAAPQHPLRYNLETLALLMPEQARQLTARLASGPHPREPNAVDVVKQFHRWPGVENYQAVRTTGQLVQVWMSAVRPEAMAEVMEGR